MGVKTNKKIKRQPKREDCGIFDINPKLFASLTDGFAFRLRVGENEMRVTNQSGQEQTVNRFDLGLWY
jgi:hypothetical protein